jgi:hypothetical protein
MNSKTKVEGESIYTKQEKMILVPSNKLNTKEIKREFCK